MVKFFAEMGKLDLLDDLNAVIDTKELTSELDKLRVSHSLPACHSSVSMSKAKNSWAVQGSTLVEEAKSSPKALDLLRRICMLYALDFRCLPVQIPDACADMQLDAPEPKLAVSPTGVKPPSTTSCCQRVEQEKKRSKYQAIQEVKPSKQPEPARCQGNGAIITNTR